MLLTRTNGCLAMRTIIGKTSQDQSQGTAAARDDFGIKGLTSSEAAATTEDLAKEIANSCLAMRAIIGKTSQDQSQGTASARDDFGVKGLTSSEAAATTKEFAKEITTGCLAMRAILPFSEKQVKWYVLILKSTHAWTSASSRKSRSAAVTCSTAFAHS
jgi:gamma-glutamylcysteine synthetase